MTTQIRIPGYFENNPILEKLPKHLMVLCVEQNYSQYTFRDHAIWRHIMRKNFNYLRKFAHESYVEGLSKTGIPIEQIPDIRVMNKIMGQLGWACVSVDGFIPPGAFMEFQAYRVLPIASTIRQINQVEYTPSPDIVHEAAGHAPIIADPYYADYLQKFGVVGSNAFMSNYDWELYEAIRHLSLLKEDPASTPEEIELANKKVLELQAMKVYPSEISKIRNLHWWTVEYGLIGKIDNPKLYGAGLLSSIGESKHCLTDKVKKYPYTLDAVNFSFDITTMQPQLFVTPDFTHLHNVLELISETFAYKRGGLYAVQTAINSGRVATLVLSSGLQISGLVSNVIESQGYPLVVRFTGPTQLAFENKELEGHSKNNHKDGFTFFLDIYNEIRNIEFEINQNIDLSLTTGIEVRGKVTNIVKRNGNVLLVSLRDALVKYKGEIIFKPEWGVFDVPIARFIISAFPRPADPEKYEYFYPVPSEKVHPRNYSEKELELFELYKKVRDVRENNKQTTILRELFEKIEKDYPEEWLLPLEIYEIYYDRMPNDSFTQYLESYLWKKKEEDPSLSTLISEGISLVKERMPLLNFRGYEIKLV